MVWGGPEAAAKAHAKGGWCGIKLQLIRRLEVPASGKRD